jgi:ferrochelatase
MARLIVKELEGYSHSEMKEGLHVLFSAHGVPQSYIAAGDPYQRQIEECVRLISREVSVLLRTGEVETRLTREQRDYLAQGEGAVSFHLSFQSRVGPVQWLKPYTEEKVSTTVCVTLLNGPQLTVPYW